MSFSSRRRLFARATPVAPVATVVASVVATVVARVVATVVATVAWTAWETSAHAQQSEGATRDFVPSGPRGASVTRAEGTNPLRGSTLTFEQSATTQTAHIETAPQQSYVPLYEIWLSLRPRYHFDDHWSVRGRFDFTKELTNNQPTTYYREDVFGDIWTDLVYESQLDALWRGTAADVGLRALWPSSKISQASGTYLTLGARAGASHQFEVRGEDAPSLENFHVALRFVYQHPFTTATTPTSYGNFAYVRQNTDEQSFVSDQVQGATLVDHEVFATLEAGLQITPKLSLTGYMILINAWHYPPSYSAPIGLALGRAVVAGSGNDTQFTQDTWLIASLDYALADEVGVGLGYYNLANAIARDGQPRGVVGSDNVWWSPDARVFLTLTANLDALYDDAIGHKYSSKPVRRPAGVGAAVRKESGGNQ